MRIFVDLQWMVPGYTGGIEYQARSFLHTLIQSDAINEYRLLLPYQAKQEFDLHKHSNFKTFFFGGPSYYFSRVVDETAQRLNIARLTTREKILRQATTGIDVALSFTGYTAPNLLSLPTVLNVPDIQHEFLPELFSPEELDRRKAYYRVSIQAAKHICAISNFTRQTLIERLDVPEEKITVTHLAPDSIFKQQVSEKTVKDVCLRYHIPYGEYFYFPAATWPHKNHLFAIRTLYQFNRTSGRRFILVCSGPQKEALPEIKKLIQQLNMEDQVRFLGFVPRSHLPALYSGAAALLFPSLFEGFGMPVLEAMACGCPVLCSNTTSLPEIAGDAAILFDPHSVDALVEEMKKVILEPGLRASLIHKGLERASMFSWESYTETLSSVLKRFEKK